MAERWGRLVLALCLCMCGAAQAPDNSTLLTPDEQAWIRDHPVVRFSAEPNWPPLEFVEDGHYGGIASGYLKLLERATGLHFEYVPAKDWDEAVALAREGKVDLLPCIGDTAERRAFLLFTRPYLSFPLVIITRKDAGFVGGLHDLQSKLVAVPEGFYIHERLRVEYPEIRLLPLKGEEKALRAVAEGRADAFVGNVAIASYVIDKHGLANLKVAAPTEFQNSELCMAVRPELMTLQRILQKGLDGLPDKAQDTVRQQWIGVRYEYGINPQILWRALLATVLILGPVAVASYVYTRRLHRQVARRRAAEERLAKKTEILQTTLDHMAQGILMADADGRVLAFNRNYQQFFGYSDAYLAARPTVADIFMDYWAPRGYDDEAIAQSIADTKRTDFFEYELVLEDGRVIDVMHAPAPGGGFVRTYTDISERKRAEEETRRLADVAEAANRAKGAFLANMSHEIRTPLNAIIGFGQLLQRSEDISPQHRENIHTMTTSGQHLLTLINDILDMSKLEAGRTQLQPNDFDLAALMRDTTNMFRLRAEEKGLHYHCHLDERLPRLAKSDDGKLRQIIINLIGNAVKFTEQGSITVRANATPLAGLGEWRLRVEVEDTGPGIDPEEAGQLFKAFSQTSTGAKTKDSTGLGLAISREFARLMGGDIFLVSRRGVGATFIVEVLFTCLHYAPLPSEKSAADSGDERTLLHLAEDLRLRLAAAADRADSEAILELASHIANFDPEAAEKIRAAVAEYAYDQIVTMTGITP